MTSPLKHYSSDPMGKNRGAGYYYKRSHKGNKNWKSKYDIVRDSHRKSSPSNYTDIRYIHTGDRQKYTGKALPYKKYKRV